MPKIIVCEWRNDKGEHVRSVCFSAVEMNNKPYGVDPPIVTGYFPYKYRKQNGEAVVDGRSPIGPRRAAANRPGRKL